MLIAVSISESANDLPTVLRLNTHVEVEWMNVIVVITKYVHIMIMMIILV